MRFCKALIPSLWKKGSSLAWRRQMTVVLAVLAISGCSSNESDLGTVGFVEGYIGGVVSDEPRAALIGRDVLSAGGSAADAAIAVYFALSVTLPSSASLGGGGICVIHDRKTGKVETLDFLARAPNSIPSSATRPTAIPANPRGFFALYSKYGRLRWAQLISPAEKLARFGTRVSRAFAQDLAAVNEALIAESDTRRIFGRSDVAAVKQEGDFLTQLDLSGVLGVLRTKGPGDFYNGRLSRQIVEAVTQAGGSLTVEDLRNYVPVWRETVKVPLGNETAHFATPPAAAGPLAAQMLAMLADDDKFEDAKADERNHLLAEAALFAYADRGRWLQADGLSSVDANFLVSKKRIQSLMQAYRPDRHVAANSLSPALVQRLENPSATGFVTVDNDGSAVACTLTMNNLFGAGRIAPGTGILLAAIPGPGGRGPTPLGPMLMVNENVKEFFFGAAASGGVTAPTALINVAARTLLGKQKLRDAIAAKRVHHGGKPDLLYYEKGLGADVLSALSGRGHRTVETTALGRVNAISCPDGIPPEPETCEAVTDPRGFGLAVTAD